MISVLSNVTHEMPFELGIVLYFFLGSLSAGAFIFSTLPSVFNMKKYEKIGRIEAFIAFIILILIVPILILDLEQPSRFFHLFYMFNWKSALSWGTLFLTLYFIVSFVYIILQLKQNNKKLLKIVGAIGIPIAAMVSLYPGIVLGVIKARALWHVALMPIIFFMAAVLSGISIMILIVYVRNKFFVIHRVDPNISTFLGRLLFWSLIFELLLMFFEMMIMLNSGAEAVYGANILITGALSFLFIKIYIILGTIIPLIILGIHYKKETINGDAISAVLVLIGIFALRYVIVIGGQLIPLS